MGYSMNYLLIDLLEAFFMKELQSHSYDGGRKKRIFEVRTAQDKGILKQRIQPNLSNYSWKLIMILEVLLQIATPADTPATVNHKSKPNHNILLGTLIVTVRSSPETF